MNPNPPQGDTYSCWAAAVVCAAHDLGYDVERYRSADGLAVLVAAYPEATRLAADGTGGMNHVAGLARFLGIEVDEAYGQDAPRVKALVAAGKRVIVNWNCFEVTGDGYNGKHMGAVLRWANEVSVSDSCADAHGSLAEMRTFRPPRAPWFKPKIVVLSPIPPRLA